ncbi:hypothetical protein I4U23_005357 [Adineta vaga]|nr:hypothetical protein I4U23_005357 [Adineta vaga]
MAQAGNHNNIESSRLWEDYKDIQYIDKGGFGKVYQAIHICDERRCAIKRIDLKSNKKETAVKEVRILVNLSHDNVVRYYTAWFERHSLDYNLDRHLRILCRNNNEHSSSSQYELSNENEEDVSFDSLQSEINDMKIHEGRKENRKVEHFSNESNSCFTFIDSNTDDSNTDDQISSSHNRNRNNDVLFEKTVSSDTENASASKVSCNSTDSSTGTTEDFVQTKEYLYIAVELCHHHTLYHRLLPENRSEYIRDRLEGLKIFYQIVNGMTYIHQHEHKLIHRDLKPANIFFSLSANTVKIGDFGLTKQIIRTDDEDEHNLYEQSHHLMIPQESLAESHHHRTDQYSTTVPAHGTAKYISPEQKDNKQPTQKVDIYAMGLILLELLYPFKTLRERERVLENARNTDLKLPDDFDMKNNNKTAYGRLIRRLIVHDADLRPTSSELQQSKKYDIDREDYQRLENETSPNIPPPIVAITQQETIAGGNRQGHRLNQLSHPHGIYVDDDDQCIYVADYYNHRIVKWNRNAKNGQLVAGGNGKGNRSDQLNHPTDVIVDKELDSLIICDCGNKRVVRWARQNGKNGQIIISEVRCIGLTMDDNGSLYVVDGRKNEVRRWARGDLHGTIIAGGDGRGYYLNLLSTPNFIFVDQDYSVYVSDHDNHRVMKWVKGAKEGIVVAGGQGRGDGLRQLWNPEGVAVDHVGNVYVADSRNDRIVCWPKGGQEGNIIVSGNGSSAGLNQLKCPKGLSFDREGNLYVVDCENNRVQKIFINRN